MAEDFFKRLSYKIPFLLNISLILVFCYHIQNPLEKALYVFFPM